MAAYDVDIYDPNIPSAILFTGQIQVTGTNVEHFYISGVDQLNISVSLPNQNTFSNGTFTNTVINTIPNNSLYEQGAAYYIINGSISNATIASDQAYFYNLSTNITINITETPCFNEGTKILYLNKKMVDEYICIELLRKGDFVKTFKHGYRKIDMIGRNVLINNPNIYKNCMYKMVKTDTNGLLEDLIVTGGHSIMVDEMTEKEKEMNDELFLGPTPILDKKYLLLAAVSNQFVPIEDKKEYTYYHFVLDNEDDEDARYGIWANGILTETPSKQYFKKQKFIMLDLIV